MLRQAPLTVGILRPPDTTMSHFFADAIFDGRSRSLAELRDHRDSRIADMRTMFEEAADKIGVRLNVAEYQLHDGQMHYRIMGRKRQRDVRDNHILAGLDPTATQYQFLTRPARHKPLHRAVIGYTSRDALFDAASMHGAGQTSLVSAGSRKALRSVFVLHTPLNDESAAKGYPHNLAAVESAIRYPFIDPLDVTKPDELIVADEDDPLARPENIDFLGRPGVDMPRYIDDGLEP